MASSEVEIMNRALVACGVSMITSATEDTQEARVAALQYPNARDTVLQAHPWQEAIKRTSLAQLATAPDFGFSYRFALPTDFLRLIDLEAVESAFEIENGELLIDDSAVNIIYIHKLTSVPKMKPGLQEAIAARLAFEICMPLTRDPERSTALFEVYGYKVSEARFVNAAGGPDRRLEARGWVQGRYTGGVDETFRKISAS